MMDGATWPAERARQKSLLVTAHFVFAGRIGGAEHMLYNLLHGLTEAGVTPTVLCADPANLDPAVVTELAAPGRLLACGGGQGSRFIAEQRSCLARSLKADAILFANYFVPPIVPRRLGRVSTIIHDVQFRHFPTFFSAKKRAWLKASQGFAIRRADAVVAISEFVRRDLIRVYGEGVADKIVTIPNPISWERFGPPGPARPIARPYILSVAAQYAHKNLLTLVRAFAIVAKRDPDVMLVFCGQSYAGLRGVKAAVSPLDALITELGLTDRVMMTGYVDDLSLGNWYRHAALFAFPSLFEGFGMPAAEAIGFGLPTLTSDRTALPEVTQGLATTIGEAEDSGAWASALLDALGNPAAHRPDPTGVAALRESYGVRTIGEQYRRVAFGEASGDLRTP